MRELEAFTLIELLICVMIVLILASAGMLSTDLIRQTAKREAERVAAFIHRAKQKAERFNRNFSLETYSSFIRLNWGDRHTIDDSFRASSGCSYSDNFGNNGARYNANKRVFSEGGTITVRGADGNTYYVVLAIINEGRARISDDKP